VDRELVFVVLGLLLFGALTLPGSLIALAWRQRSELNVPGAVLERRAAWRLVGPLLPSAIGLSGLIGWALVEPEDAERPPWLVFVLGLPVLFVCLRVAVRAAAALRPRAIETAATLGILQPHIVVDQEFAASLDDASREAVLAHERAHARHRDPLRVWLAQILTDLQWPLPGAWARFEAWRAALELARDDEAREVAEGDDLAAAVLSAARRGNALTVVGVASNASTALRARVERLLAPLPVGQAGRRFPLALAFVGAVVAALFAGSHFGEGLVHGLCGR
jgi:Zn-dependent protease with chaperone function